MTAKRDMRALRMRLRGRSFRWIAWRLRYRSQAAAWRAVMRALRRDLAT